MTVKDALGERMKLYESVETHRRFLPFLPVYARIDGRCFSKLTKNLKRPFDYGFSRCMVNTTSRLVKETNARIGYTQSDEISLCWIQEEYESQYIFNGKVQKMVSNLASLATSYFIQELLKTYELNDVVEQSPSFDCRVFQLPNKVECMNVFYWRFLDCKRNAISSLATYHLGHKKCMNLKNEERIEKLKEIGIDIEQLDPKFYFGTFAKWNTNFERRTLELVSPNMSEIEDRVEFIFGN